MDLQKRRGLLVVWAVVAAVIWVGAVIYFQPWGTELGVPGAPKRTLLAQIFDFWVLKLPLVLLAFAIVARRPKWLAPRGKYQPGRSYALFNPYTYTAIAFMSALFAASGVSSFQVFDLPAAAAAITAAYFNPVVTFFTLWIGGTLRAIVFGQGNPVQWFLSVGLSDGMTWLYLSLFYWMFRESKLGQNTVGRLAFWIPLYWVWRTATVIPMLVWYVPSVAYQAALLNFWGVFMTGSTVASIAGLGVAEALIRGVEGRTRAAAQSAGD